MAITIQQSPQLMMPVYNPCILAVTSSNQTQESFNFVFDIFSASTPSRLARIKLPQNPDGIGVIDLHRVLENYVSFDINPSSTGITNAINSRMKYDVYIGEEYKNLFPMTVGFNSGGAQAFSSSTVHTFSTGDRLNITTNNSSLNGVYSITVLNTKSFALNTNFVTTSVTGTAIYSDYRKTVFSGLNSITDMCVVNAALPHQDFRAFAASNYYIGTSTSKFLTDVPDEYEFRTGSTAWLNVYTQAPALYTGTTTMLQVGTFNSAGYVEGIYQISGTTSSSDKLRQVAVGPYNLSNTPANAVFGSLPIIKGTTTRYVVSLLKAGNQATEFKYFTINQNCTLYDEVQLLFLDRKGSFISKTFELASKQSIDIQREEYKKQAGKFYTTWTYNTYDRGRTVYSTNFKRKFTANSNWITEEDAAYLEQLFTSPEVYWFDNGVLKAVVITSNSYEVKERVTSKLINVTIDFELANTDEVQRG